MRFIEKNKKQPPLLLAYKKTPDSSFDGMPGPVKAAVKNALLAEQGHICCYCMQRIAFTEMKVEHWSSQAEHRSQGLDYRNMLGACMGGEGLPPHLQHCDTRKGSRELSIRPTDSGRSCERLIRYYSSGVVSSENTQLDHELNEVLNLNLPTLKTNRATVLTETLKDLGRREPSWTVSVLDAEIARWRTMNSSFLRPYCHVVVSYLESKRAKL